MEVDCVSLLKALSNDQFYLKIHSLLERANEIRSKYMSVEILESFDGLNVKISNDRLVVQLFDAAVLRIFYRSTRPIDLKRANITRHYISFSPRNTEYHVVPYIDPGYDMKSEDEYMKFDTSLYCDTPEETYFQYSLVQNSITLTDARDLIIRLRNLPLYDMNRIELHPLISHPDFIERVDLLLKGR